MIYKNSKDISGVNNLGRVFAVSSVTFIGYDNIAVPRLTAEIWEHYDIAKKEAMGQVVLYTVIRTSLIVFLSSS